MKNEVREMNVSEERELNVWSLQSLTDCAEEHGGIVSWENGLKPDTVASGEAKIFAALLRDALGNRHSTYAARLVIGEGEGGNRGGRGRGVGRGRGGGGKEEIVTPTPQSRPTKLHPQDQQTKEKERGRVKGGRGRGRGEK